MNWRTKCSLLAAVLTLGLIAVGGSSAQSSAAQSPRAAQPVAHSQAAIAPACGRDYYKNVSGNCVHRPSSNPSGATARCRDGSYSYSQHASGTCSGHGGVATWIHHP